MQRDSISSASLALELLPVGDLRQDVAVCFMLKVRGQYDCLQYHPVTGDVQYWSDNWSCANLQILHDR